MKKIVRTVALLVFTFTASLGMAKKPVLTAKQGAKTVILAWEERPETATLAILAANGDRVYSEKVFGKMDYAKKFDLGSLPQGNYFLKAEDALTEVVYALTIDDRGVRVTEKRERFKPSFRKEGSRIFLNYLNLDKHQVRISVYDDDRRILHSEILDGQSIGKSFDFRSAVEGDYVIEIEDDENRYRESIMVD
ncbi:MAG: hypothetical protein WA913_08155 [Pricia sp.]